MASLGSRIAPNTSRAEKRLASQLEELEELADEIRESLDPSDDELVEVWETLEQDLDALAQGARNATDEVTSARLHRTAVALARTMQTFYDEL